MTDTNNNPFENKEQPNPETPAPSSDNPFADQLSAIKNDKGEPKYNSVEDALKALEHSQNFINTLKKEASEKDQKLQELSGELEKRESVEEVVERLVNKNQSNPAPTDDQPKAGVLDENKILNVVKNVLQEQEKETTSSENLTKVITTLTSTYGDSASQVIKDRARELNTTPSALENLAKDNPNLVLSLFSNVDVQNLNPTTPNQTPPRNMEKPLEAPKPERSLMKGASNREIIDMLRKSKEYTNKRIGVEN